MVRILAVYPLIVRVSLSIRPSRGVDAVQSGIQVDVRCPVFFDEGVELHRELEQVLAQDLGPDGVPPLGVVPERLEEVILVVDGRHGADYTPVPAPCSAWPVAAVSLAATLRPA